MTTSLTVKIAKAALDVGGKLSADKTNQEQRYDYLSADKILSVCGQALFNQGVVIMPELAGQDTQLFEYTDQYGKARRRYDTRVDFNFRVTDGEVTEDFLWFGMGSDYTVPDKALYKAITSGHKYFLMKLLCVGAGNEDGEHEGEEGEKKPGKKPAPQPANGKQAEPPAKQGVYSGPTVKIGKNTYPQAWGKAIADAGVYSKDVNAFEIDGILQKLNLADTTGAEVVRATVGVYLETKASGGDPLQAANDYFVAVLNGLTEEG